MAEAESYLEVLPEAKSFDKDEAIITAVEALGGEIYGSDFGKSIINEVFTGLDEAGNTIGYAFSVTSKDAFDGSLTLSVGIAADGTVTGIAFTEINETAGMGMNADQPEWKAQFAGVNTDRFTLNKSGGATADNDINSVSGASVTSGAVVNAVNAALDFFAANIK